MKLLYKYYNNFFNIIYYYSVIIINIFKCNQISTKNNQKEVYATGRK